MHLFLIRHGETVDNVAGLYAGSRDSALTTHGVLQTRRLGTHLARLVTVKHIFSSNLQRAAKTAQAILDAQKVSKDVATEVVQLPELREKDFGSGEGTKYGVGKGERIPHEGAETPEAMRIRSESFLDDHLFNTLRSMRDDASAAENAACVVVAHGLILNTLFRALCSRILPGQLTLSPDASRARPEFPGSLPVLPSWSNTGFLHCFLTDAATGVKRPTDGRNSLPFKLHIKLVNCTDHNKGLRKTRGGIGSAEFDGKQKSLDSFFTKAKKRKADDAVS